MSKLECRGFATVLVAPKSYLAGSDHGFGKTIELERILEWFQSRSSQRSRYKASMLRSIIAKRETEPAKDLNVTQFWKHYYDLARRIAPRLGMRPPGGRSGGFLFFSPNDKPRYLDVVHKLNRGYVDLQFAMPIPAFDQFANKIRAVAYSDMLLRRTGNSLSVSIWVGELATNKDFSAQRETVENGIHSAERLWDWFQKNRSQIEDTYLSLIKQPG